MTKTVQDMMAEARAAVPTITPQEAMNKKGFAGWKDGGGELE